MQYVRTLSAQALVARLEELVLELELEEITGEPSEWNTEDNPYAAAEALEATRAELLRRLTNND